MIPATNPFGDAPPSVNYEAANTVTRFILSPAFTRFILGPVGSGKTTGVLFEVLRRCCAQAPGPDGIRRTRWAIVRNTLSQLKQTVLRDIEQWLRPIINFRVSDNIIIIEAGDVHSEWFLIPLSEPDDQKRLLSMQLTGIWINEFIELDPSLLPPMSGRIGRFPSAAQGGPSWFGIVGDSNMPNVGSEWHRLLDLDTPPDWEVFLQPSGLSPDAENLSFLTQTADTLRLPVGHPDRIAQGRTYYERLSRQHGQGWVQRYVKAQYGDDPDGTAVFRGTFVRATHVVKGRKIRDILADDGTVVDSEYEGGITPIPGRMLIIAQDFGRAPCSLILQPDHRGRLLALDEVVSLDTGLELHVTRYLKPRLLTKRYAGMNMIVVGDPSGVAKSTVSEETAFDTMERLGFAAQPAPTNDIDARIRAVDSLFMQRDGIAIDEGRCPTLVKALNGLYRYGKTKAGQTKPLPDKTHPWSDIADCLQYGALTMNPQFQRVMARTIAKTHGRSSVQRAPAFSSRAWT